MLIRGIYGVVYSTIIIGMFRYIIIIIYEVPTSSQMVRDLEPRNIGGLGQWKNSRKIQSLAECEVTYYKRYAERLRRFLGWRSRTSRLQSSKWPQKKANFSYRY